MAPNSPAVLGPGEPTVMQHTHGPRKQTPGPWQSKEIAWQYNGSHALLWCDKSKGGQHWRRLDEQCNGLLRRLCPMERQYKALTFKTLDKPRKTTLTDHWKSTNNEYIESYLSPLLPASVSIALVGHSHSHRQADEQPDRGMTARLWRVYPSRSSNPVMS